MQKSAQEYENKGSVGSMEWYGCALLERAWARRRSRKALGVKGSDKLQNSGVGRRHPLPGFL